MVGIPVQGTSKSGEELRKPARPDAGELGTYAGNAERSAAPRAGKRRAREEDEDEDKENIPRGLGRSVKKLKTSMSIAAGDKRRASESDDLDDLDEICRPVKKLKTAHIQRSILKAPTSTFATGGAVEKKKKQVRWCSSVVGEGLAVLPCCSASLSPVARPPRTIRKQKLDGQQAAAAAAKRTKLADDDDREAAMAKVRAMQEEVEAAAVKAFRRRQAEARQRRERLREYCEASGVEIWKVLVL
ncbi:hypothetical protein C8Q74DRAFT_1242694 [Fomes fomentarius]|nr:hypothetical protein C8Q74DRAFT_1242694 [Fomes fomentarius]